MDSQVIPSMKNLKKVLAEGDRVSKEIEKLQHETESSITSLFSNIPGLSLLADQTGLIDRAKGREPCLTNQE